MTNEEIKVKQMLAESWADGFKAGFASACATISSKEPVKIVEETNVKPN